MAVDFLHELGVPFFKVASCDSNNFPYLEKTAKKGMRAVYHVTLSDSYLNPPHKEN